MALDLNRLVKDKYYEFTINKIPVFACKVIHENYPQLLKSADGLDVTLVDMPLDTEGSDIIEITEEKFKEYQQGFVKNVN